MSDIYYITSFLVFFFFFFFLLVRGYGGEVSFTKCQPGVKFSCSREGPQLLFHVTSPTIYYKHSKNKEMKCTKMVMNRHIGILSFTFASMWEQNVHFILLSIANSATYLKILFLCSFLPPELSWNSPYSRISGDISDWQIITSMHMWTIHYHICCTDKYRYVQGPKFHNFGRFGISYFEKEGFCKSHPKSWESFLHIPSPIWADLMSPYGKGLRHHQPFRGHLWLTNYSFHTHGQYCTTFTTIFVILTNTEL